MAKKKNYRYLMDQLIEYFENTMVPRTIGGALNDLGIDAAYASTLLKRLRQDFPDEMQYVEDSHYCMPTSSRGSIIRGYFFVRYRDDIIRYIEDDLGFDKIYEILMKDPKNYHVNITKKEFMKHVYHFANNGCCPEIKKAYSDRAARRLGRLEELYKDVMRSKPYTYSVRSICEKYKISRAMVYLFIKHTKCGNKLIKLLDYTENTNCNSRSYNSRLIEDMKQEGFDTKEISDMLGISERYVKYGSRVFEHMDERVSKVKV